MVFSLALRNVLRNKRRTLLTMAGIVAGTVSILLLGGDHEIPYWACANRSFAASTRMCR